MSGEFTQTLPNFKMGRLIVNENHWKIQFYFSGPDLRYNGTSVIFYGNVIDQYIKAYSDNWNTYVNLKEIVSSNGGEMTKKGDMNMTIRVGGYAEGVCIGNHHLPIRSKEYVGKIIADLQWANERANEIRKVLYKL